MPTQPSRVVICKDLRVLLVKAMWIDGSGMPKEARIGLSHQTVMNLKSHGGRARFFQLQNIVVPGLIDAQHIFQGLKRPMFSDGSMEADATKLVYTWKPPYDFDRNDVNQDVPQKHYFPKGKTFAVVVSPIREAHRADYPMIEGWINHWGIVDEAGNLAEAPINWETRYLKKLWSKK